MKCFMIPTNAKLTDKRPKITHETITIFHTSLPISSTSATNQIWNNNVKRDVKPKANAHSKKSLASIVIKYVFSTVIAFAFHFTGGLKREIA